MTDDTRTCGKIGALIVGGKVVGSVKCELDAGHSAERWVDGFGNMLDAEAYAAHNRAGGPALSRSEPSAHRMTLEWIDDGTPDLDLFDPAEKMDVEVPLVDEPYGCQYVHNFGLPQTRETCANCGLTYEEHKRRKIERDMHGVPIIRQPGAGSAAPHNFGR